MATHQRHPDKERGRRYRLEAKGRAAAHDERMRESVALDVALRAAFRIPVTAPEIGPCAIEIASTHS